MMVEGSDISEIYRRQSEVEPKWYPADRKTLYFQSRMNAKSLYDFLIWGGSEAAVEGKQRRTKTLENQRLVSDRAMGNMETRQKLRGAEEQHNAEVGNRSWKGKSILQDEQPFKIWDVEDDSEEDLGPDEGRERLHPQESSADDVNQQTGEDQAESLDMNFRRYGLRKRSRTPNREGDSERKKRRGQRKKAQEEGENSKRDQNKDKKQKKTVNHRIRRAEQAYYRNSNPAVRRIMQYLEEESLQDQFAEEMEEWEFLLHDPGHTRGRMSLFKQSLHIYWVMKGLMAKALEQVAKEMVELAQEKPDIRRELSFIRIVMARQEEKLDAIQQMLNRDHPEPAGAANQQPNGGND